MNNQRFMHLYLPVIALAAMLWPSSPCAQMSPIQSFVHDVTPNDEVHAVFSPDGSKMATYRGNVRVWNAETGAMLYEFTGNTSLVSSAVFSPAGGHLAVGDWNSNLFVLDAETGEVVRQFKTSDPMPFGFWVTALAFSHDGTTLAAGNENSAPIFLDMRNVPNLRLWNVETGEELTSRFSESSSIRNVDKFTRMVFSPLDDYIIPDILFFDAETGDYVFSAGPGKHFFLDDYRIVNYYTGKEHDIRTGEVLREFPPVAVTSSEIEDALPEKGLLLTTGTAAAREIDRLSADGERSLLRRYNVEFSGGGGAKFSPDGTKVVTTRGNTAYLWDISDLVTAVPNAELHQQ